MPYKERSILPPLPHIFLMERLLIKLHEAFFLFKVAVNSKNKGDMKEQFVWIKTVDLAWFHSPYVKLSISYENCSARKPSGNSSRTPPPPSPPKFLSGKSPFSWNFSDLLCVCVCVGRGGGGGGKGYFMEPHLI